MVEKKRGRISRAVEGLQFRRVYSAYGSGRRLLGELIDLPPFDPAAAAHNLRRGGEDLAVWFAALEALKDSRVRAARELGQRYPFHVEYIQDGLRQMTDTSVSGTKPIREPYNTRVFINPLGVATTPEEIEDIRRRFGLEPLVVDVGTRAVIIGRRWGLYRIGAEDHVGIIKIPEVPIMKRVSKSRARIHSDSLQTAIDYNIKS